MRQDAEQRQSLERACDLYQSQMTEAGLSYLLGRGIDQSVAEDFRLGQVVDPLPTDRIYRGRIAIPVLKRIGCTGFSFRCIEDHHCKDVGHSKYLTKGPQQLFNVKALESSDRVIGITEGQFDGIINSGIVGIPSCGIPGVKAWKSHPWWKSLFAGHRRVLVFTDNDAGKDRNYGSELGDAICSDIPAAEIISMPDPPEGKDKMDVTDTALQYGPGYLLELAGM